MKFATKRAVWKSTTLVALSLLNACTVTPPGANDAHLAEAKNRAAHGGQVFATACAGCHGPRGEGLATAPSVMVPNALPRYPRDQSGIQRFQDPELMQRQAQLRVPGAASRPEFVSALDLHGFLKTHWATVKKPAGTGELAEQDYWALVSFMLIAHGSEVPAELSPENAASVPIRSE